MGELKVFQYFGCVRHNPAALDTFVEVMKHCKLFNAKSCFDLLVCEHFANNIFKQQA